MGQPVQPVNPTSDRSPECLEWRVHLARRAPARAVATLALAAGVGAAAYVTLHSLAFALVAAGLLLAAAGEFLFPTSYRLNGEWAESRNPFCWRRIAWKEVMRVYAGNEEIKLSPLVHAGRREAFRGVLLRCEGNQTAVLDAINRFRNAATGS